VTTAIVDWVLTDDSTQRNITHCTLLPVIIYLFIYSYVSLVTHALNEHVIHTCHCLVMALTLNIVIHYMKFVIVDDCSMDMRRVYELESHVTCRG